MPRTARKLSDTGIYHVMMRGVNKQEIFQDDEDRKKLLQILKYYKGKYSIKVYAYCLMTNHVHLLIKDTNYKMDKFVKDMAGLYSRIYNTKYSRIGHLFQDRYKSEEVENQDYLLSLIRYIHKNPEKAGICKMKDYKWSSFKEYIFNEKIIYKKDILEMYNENNKKAIALFEHFSFQEDNNVYLDINNASRRTEKEIFDEINLIICIKKLKECNRTEKAEMIKKIIKIEGINILQISKLTGVDRKTIYKYKRK